jgi:hypothetical protein
MKLLIAPGSKPFKRLLLFSFVSLVLVGAQVFIWSWVHSLAAQWKQNRSQEQQLAQLNQRLASIKSNYAQQQPAFGQLSVLTPHVAQTPQLVSQLEKLADANNVSEVTKTITEGPPGDPQPLIVTLEAKGHATELLHYLKAIEQLPELVALTSWSLDLETETAASGAGSVSTAIKPNYTLAMSVVFFLQP